MRHVTEPPHWPVTQDDVSAVQCEKASLVDNVKHKLEDESDL